MNPQIQECQYIRNSRNCSKTAIKRKIMKSAERQVIGNDEGMFLTKTNTSEKE